MATTTSTCTAPTCTAPAGERTDGGLCERHHVAVRNVTRRPVRIDRPRAGWRADADCLGMDTDAWYPDGQGDKPQEATIAVCAGCTVRDDCLLTAAANREIGWWGGVSPRNRTILARKASRLGRRAA